MNSLGKVWDKLREIEADQEIADRGNEEVTQQIHKELDEERAARAKLAKSFYLTSEHHAKLLAELRSKFEQVNAVPGDVEVFAKGVAEALCVHDDFIQGICKYVVQREALVEEALERVHGLIDNLKSSVKLLENESERARFGAELPQVLEVAGRAAKRAEEERLAAWGQPAAVSAGEENENVG
jgi:hypothetical protein